MPLFLAFLAQFGPPPIWASQCREFPTLPILRTRSPDPPSPCDVGRKYTIANHAIYLAGAMLNFISFDRRLFFLRSFADCAVP
jgi:hypothetical protein